MQLTTGAPRGLATLTHARLRAAQGDVAGARRIVEQVLHERVGDAAALRLRDELHGRADAPARATCEGGPLAERVPGDPAIERERFQRSLGARRVPDSRRRAIRTLSRWLARIEDDAEASATLFGRDAG